MSRDARGEPRGGVERRRGRRCDVRGGERLPSWPAGLPHEGSSEALVRHRAGALSAGLRTHERCDRHRSLSYRSSLPRRRRPVLRDDFRSRLPLRGSPGFTPGSLFSPWDSSPTSTDSERPDTAEGRGCQSERASSRARCSLDASCTLFARRRVLAHRSTLRARSSRAFLAHSSLDASPRSHTEIVALHGRAVRRFATCSLTDLHRACYGTDRHMPSVPVD